VIRLRLGGRASDEGASIILIDENLVPEDERADFVAEDFIIPVKAALGTAIVFDHSSVQIEKQTEAFARAHHAAHPSPLVE
jgi:hypothetical protein